ncbi:MAG: mechanosensitive ion channel [Microcoleaceae cyanobacterium]
MNETWYEIPQIVGTRLATFSLYLAQTETTTSAPNVPGLGSVTKARLIDLAVALGLLILGIIIAFFAKALVKSLLKKTDIDNRIAGWMAGDSRRGDTIPIEDWIGTAVFWIVLLLSVVGFLERLQFTGAATPLGNMLNEITTFIPKLLGAGVVFLIAWVIATLVKNLVIRVLGGFRLDDKVNQQMSPGQRVGQIGQPQQQSMSLSETIGNVLYWLIFLFALPIVLDILDLNGLLSPVQGMVDQILAILPNIFAAGLIAVIGWFIAQIVKRIVTNFLSAAGTDNVGSRFGLTQTAGGGQSLSSLIGTIVFILILIPVAIAALERLNIDAISDPAISMLENIFDIIPQIFAAAVILFVAYIFGRFISELVTSVLTSLGFNKLFYWLGLQSTPPVDAAPTTARTTQTPLGVDRTSTTAGTQTPLGQPRPGASGLQQEASQSKTPSEIVGIIAFVGVMLFAIITATDIIGLTALTDILNSVLAIAGRVLIGLVIFAIGLYFANLAYKLVLNTNMGGAKLLAQIARVAIIFFVGAMALEQMGAGSDIVNLAFGLLLGAIAVAIAISFGLGGRDAASNQIQSFLNGFNKR